MVLVSWGLTHLSLLVLLTMFHEIVEAVKMFASFTFVSDSKETCVFPKMDVWIILYSKQPGLFLPS